MLLNGFLKTRRPPKVSIKMKCTNEKNYMKWPEYEPEQLCAQG